MTEFADRPAGLAARTLAHRLGQAAIDACLLALSYWLAFELRFDDSLPHRFDTLYGKTVWIVVATNMVVFVALRFYTKWWRFTSLRDLQTIVLGVGDRRPAGDHDPEPLAPDALAVGAARRAADLDHPQPPADRRRALRGAQRHGAAPARPAGRHRAAACWSAAPARPATS